MKQYFVLIAAMMASLIVNADIEELGGKDGGEGGANLPKGNSPEAIAIRKDYFMKKTGGFVESPGQGAPILIIDARKEPSYASMKVVEVVTKNYRLPIVAEKGKKEKDVSSVNFATEHRVAKKAVMVVAIVEEEEAFPSLAIFPEDRVAVVNANRLTAGGVTSDELEIRLIKEIWRAIGFIGGSGFATHDKSVMQPLTSVLELDINEFQVMQPMEIQQMRKFFNKYGVKQGYRTTYKKAVEDGWAPAPTNDYQKAIWDAVKAAKEAAPKAEEAKAPEATAK